MQGGVIMSRARWMGTKDRGGCDAFMVHRRVERAGTLDFFALAVLYKLRRDACRHGRTIN